MILLTTAGKVGSHGARLLAQGGHIDSRDVAAVAAEIAAAPAQSPSTRSLSKNNGSVGEARGEEVLALLKDHEPGQRRVDGHPAYNTDREYPLRREQ